MISDRKRAANRANARASTGPRTAAGKDRSAKNALRHGLRSPVLSDPTLTAEVEKLAQGISGDGASAELRELAGRIAEVQIDLVRVRRARQDFIARALAHPNAGLPRFSRRQFGNLVRLVERFGDKAPLSGWAEALVNPPEGEQKLARILKNEAARLALFDRYERRSRSRRKFAIRAFDLARGRST